MITVGFDVNFSVAMGAYSVSKSMLSLRKPASLLWVVHGDRMRTLRSKLINISF